jgi:hypothetical protein
MSATKLRGRDRQETSVAASFNIWGRLYRTLIAWQGMKPSKIHQANIVRGFSISRPHSRLRASPPNDYGLSRRSIPVLLRMRLAISSIEHSVVSITGME